MNKKTITCIAIFGLLFSLLSFNYAGQTARELELPDEIYIYHYYNPLIRDWVYPDRIIPRIDTHKMSYYKDGVKYRDGIDTSLYGKPKADEEDTIPYREILPNRWKTGDINDTNDTGQSTTNDTLINAFDYRVVANNPALAKPMFRGFTNSKQVYYNQDFVNDAAGNFDEQTYAKKKFHALTEYRKYPAFGDDNRYAAYNDYFQGTDDYFSEPVVQENLRNFKAEFFPNSPNMTFGLFMTILIRCPFKQRILWGLGLPGGLINV